MFRRSALLLRPLRTCFSSIRSSNFSSLTPTINELFTKIQTGKLQDGQEVTVHAWVRSVRKQKRIAFAQVLDGSSERLLQLVFLDVGIAADLAPGMSVKVNGVLQATKHPTEPWEVRAESVAVVGSVPAEEPYPIQKKFMTQEHLRRDLPAIRFRTNAVATNMRLRSKTTSAVSRFFEDNGFFQVHPPIVTSSDCEGAGEVFTVVSEASSMPFFGSKAYLTVSTQLHLEALVMGLARVWTLTPAFRAEKSMTSRHLSEFWMLEAEIGFADSLDQIMSIVEQLIRSIATELKEKGELDKIVTLKRAQEKQKETTGEGEDASEVVTADRVLARWDSLIGKEAEWIRLSYKDAIGILKEAEASGIATFDVPVDENEGLASEHEKWLAGTHVKGPVFVTQYPKSLKPFYMLPSPLPSSTVECFDLLVPDMGELVGGSLREHDIDRLRSVIQESGIDLDSIEWYLQLRKWGSVPHGGFGLGFERLICYLGGVYNIREAIAFPRWVERCAC
ncbi:hypothetical protein V1514DRAFT_325395 [Lipomyces japonicus]|uniref:uncharacterized protein n=1 Tax=Lipomyces japonicus TaxID=56871 RepID=UPI0034CE3711